MPPDATLAPELAAFIEAQPRGTPYSRLAELVRERFGADRAVDEAAIRRWWTASHSAHERPLLRRDREVREAVLDVVGRLSGREIMEMLQGRFAKSRLPSRSALYRFLQDNATV